MKIGVLIKQVPDTATQIKLKPDASGIEETGIKWVVNPYDEFAIEAALQLKQQLGAGEVVAMTAGPERSVEALRTALAMGADRAVRVDTAGSIVDPYLTAIALAAVAKAEGLECLLGGKQAVDDDAGQVLQGVAEQLGWPQVSSVEQLQFNAGTKTFTVHRPVAGGLTEIIEVAVPAVLGCDKGLNQPRYPSLPGIMKAKSKPVVTKPLAELVGGAQAQWQVQGFVLPPERKAGQKITGEPEAMAEQLVQWLRNEVKII